MPTRRKQTKKDVHTEGMFCFSNSTRTATAEKRKKKQTEIRAPGILAPTGVLEDGNGDLSWEEFKALALEVGQLQGLKTPVSEEKLPLARITIGAAEPGGCFLGRAGRSRRSTLKRTRKGKKVVFVGGVLFL